MGRRNGKIEGLFAFCFKLICLLSNVQDEVQLLRDNGKPIDDVLNLLGSSDLPFTGLETQYSQQKFFREHLDMLVCEHNYDTVLLCTFATS